jgi:hypothetical protein
LTRILCPLLTRILCPLTITLVRAAAATTRATLVKMRTAKKMVLLLVRPLKLMSS